MQVTGILRKSFNTEISRASLWNKVYYHYEKYSHTVYIVNSESLCTITVTNIDFSIKSQIITYLTCILYMYNIEDITWPEGDTKFLFEYWKNISWVSAANKSNIFEHKKRNFVAPRNHVMLYLWYKHQWNTKPHYVAMATVIFSLVKTTCKV